MRLSKILNDDESLINYTMKLINSILSDSSEDGFSSEIESNGAGLRVIREEPSNAPESAAPSSTLDQLKNAKFNTHNDTVV